MIASPPPPDWFSTTHWSQVQAAGKDDTRLALEALEKLCRAYWPPLYGYVRRRGHSEHEAQDLTQEFFACLLARNDFAGLDPARGKFRAFLLASMNHFLANEWRDGQRLKRGGGRQILSLDSTEAERRYRNEPTDSATPDRLYDRQWAHTLLDLARNRLGAECSGDGRAALFAKVAGLLTGDRPADGHAALAADLGMSEGALTTALHRLRRRFGELLREEIAHTVGEPEEVDAELRHLFASLGE